MCTYTCACTCTHTQLQYNAILQPSTHKLSTLIRELKCILLLGYNCILPKYNKQHTGTHGWVGNIPPSYSKGSRFKFWLGDQLSLLRVFQVFSQFLQANVGIVPRLLPFKTFPIRYWPIILSLMLHSLRY
jgi:hypothetical protein